MTVHEVSDMKFAYIKCQNGFREQIQLTNHETACSRQKPKVDCPICSKNILKTSLKKHQDNNCHGTVEIREKPVEKKTPKRTPPNMPPMEIDDQNFKAPKTCTQRIRNSQARQGVKARTKENWPSM